MRTSSEIWLASQPLVGATPPLVSVRRIKAASARTPCPSMSCPRCDLADECGTIAHLPGRTGEVTADLPALLVEEICLGRLERPFEEISLSFAGIDLNAVRYGFKQQRGARRGSYAGLVGTDGKGARADQDSRRNGKRHIRRNDLEPRHKLKQQVSL
jgi:hypothetical protein